MIWIFIVAAIILSFYVLRYLADVITQAELRYETKREMLLRKHLGSDIAVDFMLPDKDALEDTIQGALVDDVHRFKLAVYTGDWIYVQALGAYFKSSNLATDKYFGTLSLFACPLNYYTPQIAIRNGSRKKFILPHIQARVKDKDLVWCEGGFDKSYDVYNERGMQLDTLSILSPEVLDVMQRAPKKADIFLKRNMLYYYLPGSHAPEKVVPELLIHKDKVLTELNDNLRRWGSSAANKDKVMAIKATELAVTPKEEFQRSRMKK